MIAPKHRIHFRFLPWGFAAMVAAGCGNGDSSKVPVVESKPAPKLDPHVVVAPSVPSTPVDPELEARRRSIPGGFVLLPDEPGFTIENGWGNLDTDPNSESRITRWTVGPKQKIEWNAPSSPGEYVIRAIFFRPHPFPAENVQVKAKLPGDQEPQVVEAGLRDVILEGAVTTTKPREKWLAEFESPTWKPAMLIPGSNDPREIGMIFLRIEVIPKNPPPANPAPETPVGPPRKFPTRVGHPIAENTPQPVPTATPLPEPTTTLVPEATPAPTKSNQAKGSTKKSKSGKN